MSTTALAPRSVATPAEPLHDIDSIARALWGWSDTTTLHAAIAGARSVEGDGEPLWLIVLGVPSSGKTEMLLTIASARPKETVILDKLTPASFITGLKNDDGGYNDLLRDLDGELLVLKDLSPILSMDATARDAIIGDLRSIYDGSFARFLASRGLVRYDSRVTILAAATPAWEGYYAIQGVLGQRFLLVRQPRRTAVLDGVNRARLRVMLAEHIRKALNDPPKSIGADEEKRLLDAARTLSRMRGVVPRDASKSITSDAVVEEPWRILAQLRQVARWGSVQLAERVALDTAPRLRARVMEALRSGETTVDGVAGACQLSRSPTERVLEDLVVLGLVEEHSSVRPYVYTPSGVRA